MAEQLTLIDPEDLRITNPEPTSASFVGSTSLDRLPEVILLALRLGTAPVMIVDPAVDWPNSAVLVMLTAPCAVAACKS